LRTLFGRHNWSTVIKGRLALMDGKTQRWEMVGVQNVWFDAVVLMPITDNQPSFTEPAPVMLGRPDVRHVLRTPCSLMLVKADAVELAPLSLPANEPVTEAVPPLLGNTNPTSPVLLVSMLWPEKVTVLLAIELGVHLAVHVEDVGVLAAPRAEQALETRENVSMEVAPVTVETFDPLVVQLEAAIVTVTVSELVPPFCNGGSKITVPVPEQLMAPVATTIAVVDELADGEVLVVDGEVL